MEKISLKNCSAFFAARNTILVLKFGPRVIKSGHPYYNSSFFTIKIYEIRIFRQAVAQNSLDPNFDTNVYLTFRNNQVSISPAFYVQLFQTKLIL